MNVLILGPVGSGKTTQARFLADFLGVPLLSTGDLLFYASQEQTEEAKKIHETMLKGELVESELIQRLMNEHLSQKEHNNGTLIDGFPRRLEEAEAFDIPIDRVVYLKVSDEEVVKRLTERGREDDKPEVIKRRMQVYHEETEPVLEYYRQKGILEEIDGERTIEEISADIQSRFVK